jgi:hypothetical protein
MLVKSKIIIVQTLRWKQISNLHLINIMTWRQKLTRNSNEFLLTNDFFLLLAKAQFAIIM